MWHGGLMTTKSQRLRYAALRLEHLFERGSTLYAFNCKNCFDKAGQTIQRLYHSAHLGHRSRNKAIF